MKYYVKRFLLKGLFVCGFGPVIYAIVYAILGRLGIVEVITVEKFVAEVISVAALAFIAGGISMVYEIEKLPLVLAIFIHAITLYLDYIVIYLMNGWLNHGAESFIIFTGCFIVGFGLIWLVVYLVTKRSTEKINNRFSSAINSENTTIM